MILKVGPKQKHLAVKEGYKLVTEGNIEKDDLVANIYEALWEHVDAEDIGLPFDVYDFVIRKISFWQSLGDTPQENNL